MKVIIMGIDPGTTSAFGVIDFEGKFLAVNSMRNYSFDRLLKDSIKYGVPVLIGGDKKETPSFIKDYSMKTGGLIHNPNYDTKKGEKKALVKKYGFLEKTKNDHEIDALASAIYAYESYKKTIKKIDKFVVENGKEIIRDKIISLVIIENLSPKYAVNKIEKKPDEQIIKIKRKKSNSSDKIFELKKRINLLEKENKSNEEKYKLLQQKYYEEKNKDIDITKHSKKLLKFKEDRILIFEKRNKKINNNNKKLKKKIDMLNRFISNVSENKILKRLDNLGEEEYKNKKKLLNFKKGDILIVDNITIFSRKSASQLKKFVDVVIYNGKYNADVSIYFELANLKDISIIKNKYFAYARFEDIKSALKKEKERILKEDPQIINRILKEYKLQRETR